MSFQLTATSVICHYFLYVLLCTANLHTQGQLSNGLDMFEIKNKYI